MCYGSGCEFENCIGECVKPASEICPMLPDYEKRAAAREMWEELKFESVRQNFSLEACDER